MSDDGAEGFITTLIEEGFSEKFQKVSAGSNGEGATFVVTVGRSTKYSGGRRLPIRVLELIIDIFEIKIAPEVAHLIFTTCPGWQVVENGNPGHVEVRVHFEELGCAPFGGAFLTMANDSEGSPGIVLLFLIFGANPDACPGGFGSAYDGADGGCLNFHVSSGLGEAFDEKKRDYSKNVRNRIRDLGPLLYADKYGSINSKLGQYSPCLLYTSPSPRDRG